MRVTFKVLDSLSPAPWDAAIRASRGPARMPPRRPASRGLPSSGDPDRSDSHGGGALGEARCLAVPRSGPAVGGILCFYRRCLARHIRSRIAACGRGARRTPGAAGPRSPAPHMMTRARARPRTGAARDRYIFGFQAPFQFIHGMRSRGGAGRAHGAQFAISLRLRDWR